MLRLMLRRLAAFIAAIGISASAHAQLSRPISGATSAPHCTAAQLASRTGACAALTPKGDEIAVVTNANAASLDPCGTSGPTGTLLIACNYSEVAARWVPIPSADYLAVNVNAAGHRIDNLGGADFNFGCNAFANGGKATLNAAGELICADDVSSSAGSGHQIQNNGTSLAAQVNLNFLAGGDNAAIDDPGTGSTLVSLPAYTRRVSSGLNFVGTISCAQAIPQVAAGTIARCKFRATSFGGTLFSNGSYIEGEGTYDMVTPAITPATGTGFRITDATFGNGGACAAGGGSDCGSQMSSFFTSVAALADTYNTTPGGNVPGQIAKPTVHFLPVSYYNFDGVHHGKIPGAGWTLDMTGNPAFVSVNGNMSTAIQTLPTGTVVIATDPTRMTMASSICGTGTCLDGDELVHAGDVMKIGSASWEDAGVGANQLVVVKGIVDSTHIDFDPPLTSNVTAQATEVGTAAILEFDNVSTVNSGLPKDFEGNRILGKGRVVCWGLCMSVNPYLIGGPLTAGAGYRTVPLQMVIARHVVSNFPLAISGACGKNDSFFTTTFSTFNYNSSSASGTFTGSLGGCGNWDGIKFAIQGNDGNSQSDDGVGSAFRIMSSGFNLDMSSVSYGFGRGLWLSSNCSVSHFDTRKLEEVAQLLWAPQGCEMIEIDGANDEHFMGCGSGGQPTCDAAAARRPWIDLGASRYNASQGDIFSNVLRFNWANLFFFTRGVPFLRVTDTGHTRIELNGKVADTTKFLDIASNETEISGDVQCDVGQQVGGFPTACDRPALGKVENLFVHSLSGFLWTGRRLDQMDPNVTLPLASLTDDNTTADKCLVSGGAGAPPRYITCPGSGAGNFDGLSDVVISSAATGQSVFFNGANWVNSFPPFVTFGSYIYPTSPSGIIAVGSTGGFPATDATIYLNPDGSAVFNELSAAVNFRVESDGNANMLVVNGTTNRVGIGTASPATPLEVSGIATATGFNATSTSAAQYSMVATTGTDPTCSSGSYFFYADNETGHLRMCDNGAASAVGAGGTITGLSGDTGGTTTGSPVTLAGGTNGIDTVRSGDTITFNIDSLENQFLTDMGGASTLSCSTTTQGRIGVLDAGELRYCDGASTSVEQTVLRKPASTSYTTSQILVAGSSGSDVVARAATISSAADMSLPGQLAIAGDSDVIQLDITGNATQTSLVNRVRNNAGTVLYSLDNSGNAVFGGSISVTCDGAGGCYSQMAANSADIPAPGAGIGNLGMNNGVPSIRLNAEGASHEIVRTPSSVAQGDILYRDGSTPNVWARLAAGTAGQKLETSGAAANPVWSSRVTTLAKGVTQFVLNGDGEGTTETSVMSFSVPANSMGSTGIVHCVMRGNWKNATTTGLLTLAVKFGGTTLWKGTRPTESPTVEEPFTLEFDLANANSTSAQTMGGSFLQIVGTAPTTGQGSIIGGTTAKAVGTIRGTSSVSTTSNQTLSVDFTLPNTNADDILNMDSYRCELL